MVATLYPAGLILWYNSRCDRCETKTWIKITGLCKKSNGNPEIGIAKLEKLFIFFFHFFKKKNATAASIQNSKNSKIKTKKIRIKHKY